jgi:hypothetical protein
MFTGRFKGFLTLLASSNNHFAFPVMLLRLSGAAGQDYQLCQRLIMPFKPYGIIPQMGDYSYLSESGGF